MTSEPRLSLVVPTLGRSPLLGDCLRALRNEADALAAAGVRTELLLVLPAALDIDSLDTGSMDADAQDGGALALADRTIRVERSGFAAANNAAFVDSRGPFWGTVNDDVVVEPGWAEHLLAALDRDSRLAAVQGLNLSLDGQRIDGAGIAWNRWWQAVQIGHGEPVGSPPADSTDIFGASATAVIYRRSALEAVIGGEETESFDGPFDCPFDERLWAYYEDVDLAWRLRAAGFGAACEPAARVRHAGSSTGRTLAHGGLPLIHGNRHRVLAQHLGRAYALRWPWMLLRDGLDGARWLLSGQVGGAAGVASGLWRALCHLPSHAHLGPARPPIAELRPFFGSSEEGP